MRASPPAARSSMPAHVKALCARPLLGRRRHADSMSRVMRRALALSLAFLIVYAAPVAADPQSPWSPGPGAVGDDTYVGVVDAPLPSAQVSSAAAIAVNGWIVDQTAEGWAGIDDVQL